MKYAAWNLKSGPKLGSRSIISLSVDGDWDGDGDGDWDGDDGT